MSLETEGNNVENKAEVQQVSTSNQGCDDNYEHDVEKESEEEASMEQPLEPLVEQVANAKGCTKGQLLLSPSQLGRF